MTLSPHTGGDLLFFSREELTAAHLDPDTLTREELLALTCRAMAAEARPIPADLEITAFPSRQGILCFVLPRMANVPSGCYLSVTFS